MGATNPFEAEADKQAASFGEALKEVADDAVALERQVADVEATLKEMKRELHKVKSEVLPAKMAEAGVSDLKLADGTSISIKDFVSGSLPKDPALKASAIKWLEDNEAGGLIKSTVKAVFGKGEHAAATALAEGLVKDGYQTDLDNGVHASTLQAFARERLKNGEPIPLEDLGLYAGQVAKIKLAK